MAVCLIIPPSRFLLDERVFPQLGILSVAAALEREDVAVSVIDLSGVENYLEVLRRHAVASPAEIFGVTATTPQMPVVGEIRRTLREARSDAVLVLGGAHVTLLHASYRNLKRRSINAFLQLTESWDHIVAGDGEKAMIALATAKFDPSTLSRFASVSKVIDADGPSSPFWTKPGEPHLWPARHLIDLESYKYQIEGAKATSVISQLGCPFQCNFCAGRSSPSYRRVRTKSDVVGEIDYLFHTYGFTGFMFYDDELNLTPRMVPLMEELTELQARLGVSFQLRGFVKAELFTREQAAAMYKAGFKWILAGFESGSDEILLNINKQATVADNERCMEIALGAGLKVKALMSIGHAGESERTCRETEDWLLKVAPDDFDATVITVYPGSSYYDDAVPSGLNVYTFTHPKTGAKLHSRDIDHEKVADFYKGDPSGGYQPHVFTDELSSENIAERRDAIERNVRSKLGIPWNLPAERKTESGEISSSVFRKSSG